MDIQSKLEKSIFEIIKEDGYGVGFFIKINFKSIDIHCLMASYIDITEPMLNKDYIEVKTSNKIIKKIYLNKKRWVSKELGYICIEISKDDDIELLEIDNIVDDNENNKDFNAKNIIIATINKNKKIEVLKDILVYGEISDKFYYICNIGKEFSGSSIILNNNLEVRGINYGNIKKKQLYKGIYMSTIIKDINKYNLIEGELEIKNNLLFNSEEDILFELYINNKKRRKMKDGKKNYCFDFSFNKGKYEFKIYFYNLINNISFNKCINLQKIDFTFFDTSNFTDMEFMFNECYELTEIKGINKFNTIKVRNMKGMFNKCNKLINLDLDFDTSNVTNMACMFNGCNELKEIKGISKFNTSKVSIFSGMFNDCKKLVNLELNFDTSSATGMEYMFNGCNELKEIEGLGKFNTSKVKNIFGMFQNCNIAYSIDK